MRHLLPCSRQMILAKMVHNIFGYQEPSNTRSLVEILEKDLDSSPSPHSLYQQISIAQGGVSVPLMICGSHDDLIVDRAAIEAWQTYFKEGDRLWQCPYGHHFFHYYQPQPLGRQILKFWQSFSPLEMTLGVS